MAENYPYQLAYQMRQKEKQEPESAPEKIYGKETNINPNDFKLFGKYGSNQKA